jgi:hypothetical protein
MNIDNTKRRSYALSPAQYYYPSYIGIRYINLTQGLKTKVDEETYVWACRYAWCANKVNNRYYAVRTARVSDIKKTGNLIYLHDEIVNPKFGKESDHSNRDSLDNTKSNLRECNKKQNCRNRGSQTQSNNPYKGVHYRRSRMRWRAAININGKAKWLGTFTSPKDAAIAYDIAAHKAYGDFAFLNFPENKEIYNGY